MGPLLYACHGDAKFHPSSRGKRPASIAPWEWPSSGRVMGSGVWLWAYLEQAMAWKVGEVVHPQIPRPLCHASLLHVASCHNSPWKDSASGQESLPDSCHRRCRKLGYFHWCCQRAWLMNSGGLTQISWHIGIQSEPVEPVGNTFSLQASVSPLQCNVPALPSRD